VGVKVLFATLIAVLATLAHAATGLLALEDFESGVMSFGSSYDPRGNAPVVSTDVARVGKYSMKSQINRQESRVSYRTELTFSPIEERWCGFSIYLPEDWTRSEVWELVANWHDCPDDWDNGHRNAPLQIETTRGSGGSSTSGM
jgi:hypothetical protein